MVGEKKGFYSHSLFSLGCLHLPLLLLLVLLSVSGTFARHRSFPSPFPSLCFSLSSFSPYPVVRLRLCGMAACLLSLTMTGVVLGDGISL